MPTGNGATPQPVQRRTDRRLGDLTSLVHLGLAEPQRDPAPPQEPAPAPEAEPTPTEQANEAVLQTALTDAGIDKTSGDEYAIDALAKLEPTDVQTIARWLKQKKTRPDTPER